MPLGCQVDSASAVKATGGVMAAACGARARPASPAPVAVRDRDRARESAGLRDLRMNPPVECAVRPEGVTGEAWPETAEQVSATMLTGAP